ncbi:MAG: DUF1559 domain-containing protein [Planctomycetota bacterium]
MSFIFTCPHCQAKTDVPEQYSGQAGECFSCGKPIQLPSFSNTESGGRSNKRSLSVFLAAGLILVCLISGLIAIVRLGGSSLTRLADARMQNASIRNLEKIAAALNAYAIDHGSYPMPATVDSKGVPMHSWRVLILPYLGEQALYDEFDLNKSWDSEDNLAVAMEMPDVYQHPAAQSANQFGVCSYYLIVGPNTLFPKTGPLGPSRVSDPASQTILVVAAQSPPGRNALGQWAEPGDLDVTQMRGVINGTLGVEIGGFLDSGVTLATVDGRGHFVGEDMPSTTVNALITPRGGEPLPDDTLD